MDPTSGTGFGGDDARNGHFRLKVPFYPISPSVHSRGKKHSFFPAKAHFLKDFSAVPAVPAVAGFQAQDFKLKVRSDDDKVIAGTRGISVVEGRRSPPPGRDRVQISRATDY